MIQQKMILSLVFDVMMMMVLYEMKYQLEDNLIVNNNNCKWEEKHIFAQIMDRNCYSLLIIIINIVLAVN